MKLPNREHAYVPIAKLTAYLLSETHTVGRSKAHFLRNLGFDQTSAATLERALFSIAQNEKVKDIIPSIHGTKYVVDGTVQSATTKNVRIRTILVNSQIFLKLVSCDKSFT